jgi:hypothetical protein
MLGNRPLASAPLAGSLATGGGGAVTGTLAATEAADTFAALGTLDETGTLAATEAADTFAATGTFTTGVTGTLAANEAADTFAATGTLDEAGTLAATEGPDVFAATGTVVTSVTGTLAATEGADTFAATGDNGSTGDTHDPGGYWSKKWAALRAREAAKGKKRKPDPETVDEVLESIMPSALRSVAPEIVAKAKTAIRQGLTVQTEAAFDRKIAQVEALMAEAIEAAERQDEEDLMFVLMEMVD